MALISFLTGCRFTAASAGTGDFVYSTTVVGYSSPTLANAVNGATYHFRAESIDLTQWEETEGVYTSSTGTFARTTVLYNSSGTGTKQSGAGTKINFTVAPQVAVVLLAEDLGPLTLASATLQTNLTAPTGTTSVTAVMAGLGGTAHLTPVYSSRVEVEFQGQLSSSTAGAYGAVQVQYGTGTAPANGVAITGTAVGNSMAATSATASAAAIFRSGGIITGLTPGTAYWFDLAFASSSTGSGCNLAGLSCTIKEF